MSDGMTESARAVREGHLYQEHVSAILNFVKSPGEEHLEAALATVPSCREARRRSRFASVDDLKPILSQRLQELLDGNKRVWADLLREVLQEGNSCRHLFEELKRLSPFADRVMLSVDYGYGFVTIASDLDDLLSGKGFGVYRGQDYAVFLSPEALEIIRVNLKSDPG